MRKLQQVVIAAVAAAGGLSAIGAGTAVADNSDRGPKVYDLYRPYQECSPQTVAENDIPIGVLGLAGTLDTACGQYNSKVTR
ncbi:hypothetical protein AR457_35555 [Streptomyces agglomeratus]|uniref:Secreted protein n=1 Tax=Streptomyces agglomeratus TaxID=285458 RepID=A0A1E5NYQ7_9ACTN|nr:hypothetical protein [Streptomyces agglomeratus]OEJ21409.1 hypothetical protein AS594_38205 [Streptomyces agglomeratus]OEJ22842.1 hypothetical protein AR457_36970 [Streptomyces agglomeratus]OEJ36174.1 hypothetical protein AR457_35555 [Streptomyces agglomeratus]OEJ36410.1 hypothetical protein BGK72_37425 [Streptomyces agglomeratus]OEJ56569.1 hypothetical protein BGM19_38635 [Streptomyces agglomeratus]